QLSKDEIVSREAYAHTGWRRVDGGWIYLHGAGAIGANGAEPSIEGQLQGIRGVSLPDPPEGQDRVACIQASLRILDLAPYQLTVPVLAGVYRALLGEVDFSEHVVGPTGVFKSELSALAQQHWGAGLDRRHLPGSWSSTDN